MSKLGLHSINPGNTLALVQRAVDAGHPWPVVKILFDGEVCVGVKAISPETTTLLRYMPPSNNDETLQDVDHWTLIGEQAWAKRLMDLIFSRTSQAQLSATDYLDPTNEPGAHGVAYYKALGVAFMELCRQATARGIHLSVPALPQGVPEWAEMVALVETGLFGLMKDGGHIWDEHEGCYRDEPIDKYYGDLIPGSPVVAGAGAYNFRHRYLYSLLEARGEVVPLVISEWYGGGRYTDPPADQVARMAWYDERAQLEPYLLAFLPFTINPNDGWKDADYGPTYLSDELWNYLNPPPPPPPPPQEATMQITVQARDNLRTAANDLLRTANQLTQTAVDLITQIDAIHDDPPPAPALLYPTGKGMLVWHLPITPAITSAGTVPGTAKAAGFKWVAVKIHDGTTPSANTAALDFFVRAFHAAGIQVYGWGYVYLNDPVGEAQIAARLCANFHLDGYMIDAEGEAAAAGADKTALFCSTLTSNPPPGSPLPIGLCSYRYPTLHQDLAWQAFLSICTFHCPQVYWLGATTDDAPAQQLARSVKELQAIAPLPVVPIGAAFPWTPAGGAEWLPTVAQLKSFIAAAAQLKLPGYGWYDWESAEQHPDWWAAIAGV